MANRAANSFDWFPSGQSASTRARLWGADGFAVHADSGNITPADVVTGRFGTGKAFALSGSLRGFSLQEAGYIVPPTGAAAGTTAATGFIGQGVYVDSGLPAQTRPMIGFYDSVNDAFQVSVSFEPNGVVKAWLGSKQAGMLLAPSVAGVYQENQFFHCETKGFIAASGGTLEVRINTVPVIQATGLNTKNTSNAYFDSVFIGGHSTNTSISVPSTNPIVFDDLFVNDTTGSTMNTWMGNLRAWGMFMIANGYLNNFTIGGSSPAATHWQSVINQILDDSSYEYDATVGDIDAFVPNPIVNGPLVRLLQMRAALRQDDATQRVGQLGVRIGGTNYFGSVLQSTNQTYTFYKDKFELSPATGVTLTGSEVNGCQALVKVQA